jgi:Pyruvate/2-oxoacid:ferredoxin oxidoreductase gamma subunit
VKEGKTGFLIWDTSTISKIRAAKRIKKSLGIPIQKLAVEKFNNIVFGNSILFGIFTVLSEIFSEESAIQTIQSFVPASTLDINLEAFELGKQEGLEFLKKLQEEND